MQRLEIYRWNLVDLDAEYGCNFLSAASSTFPQTIFEFQVAGMDNGQLPENRVGGSDNRVIIFVFNRYILDKQWCGHGLSYLQGNRSNSRQSMPQV